MARYKVTGADEFVLIDMTTGTVLGSNVVAVWNAGRFTEDQLEEVCSSDSAAREFGEAHGETLYTYGY